MTLSHFLYLSALTAPCLSSVAMRLRRHTLLSPCISFPGFRIVFNLVYTGSYSFRFMFCFGRIFQLAGILPLGFVRSPCFCYSLALLVALIEMLPDLCFVPS
ncbi:hypothetical protein CPB86DRAFT_337564 [Serendipita vermifera]|nr:hypothetical protein CPB86DRAFT_337564 [Serendipita vermifera]